MAKTFTRAELYDLVWTRPSTALAKELGISDVAIGKHCVAASIPKPPVGYWAKLNAGRGTKRIALPLRLPGQSDSVTIGKEPWQWPPGASSLDTPVPPTFAEDIDEQVAAALKRVGRVVASPDLSAPDRSLARVLESEAKRRESVATSGSDWHKPRFDKPVFQRHLRIFDSLAKALTPLYGRQQVGEFDEWFRGRGTLHHLELHLDFGGIGMNLRIHEPGEPCEDKDVRPVTVTTLRVRCWQAEISPLEWTDGVSRRIERQLGDVVGTLLKRAEEALRARAHSVYQARMEHYQQELAAVEARRLEAERQRVEAIAARKARVRDSVIELAQRQRMAQDIRATVTSLRSHPEVASAEGRAKFEAWAANALAVADGLDPMLGDLASILAT